MNILLTNLLRYTRPVTTTGTSPFRYSFAAVSFRTPSLVRNIGTTNLFHVSQFIWASPDYVTNNVRFFLPNFSTTTSSFVNNTNTLTIEALGIEVGGTVYQTTGGVLVAADGSLSNVTFPATIPAGAAGIWTNAINIVGGFPANSTYRCRVALNAPSGSSVPVQTRAVPLGLTVQGGTSSLASLVSAANYNTALSNTNTTLDLYAPALAIATGGDGREAQLVVGDSIGFGQDDRGVTAVWTSRIGFGYISRALDDNSTSRRIAHANICAPGQGPAQWQTATFWSPIRFAIQAVNTMHGDWPFDRIVSQHGTNSISSVPFNGMMQNYWTTLSAELGGKPITQLAMLPYPQSTDGFATLGNQTLNANNAITGARWIFNDALAAGTFSNQVQDFIEPWRKVSFDTTANRDKLRVSGMGDLIYNSTVASAYSGSGAISLTAAPTVGSTLSFGPGTFTAAITAVTGTGPFSCTLAPIGSTLTALTSGTSVREILHDGQGLHPSATTHRDRLAASIVEWKIARGWV